MSSVMNVTDASAIATCTPPGCRDDADAIATALSAPVLHDGEFGGRIVWNVVHEGRKSCHRTPRFRSGAKISTSGR